MKYKYLFYLLILPLISNAQYEKYILAEWFTNTYCGICSSKNPGLQQVYNTFGDKVHRVTIHPDVPYPECSLYNFNKEDNGARQAYYNINATPRIFLNGISASTSTPSAFEDALNSQKNDASSISVIVNETGGSQVRVTIESAADLTGDYRLFVVLLEKTLDFDAPNGEKEHYDVMRDYISSADGDQITLPGSGEQKSFDYSFSIPQGVSTEQAYVLAYVQNFESREILNSGTKFDEVVTSLKDVSIESDLRTFPNPAIDILNVSVGNEYGIYQVDIYDQIGQQIRSIQLTSPEKLTSFSISDLPSGTYLIQVDLGDKKGISRFVKE